MLWLKRLPAGDSPPPPTPRCCLKGSVGTQFGERLAKVQDGACWESGTPEFVSYHHLR